MFFAIIEFAKVLSVWWSTLRCNNDKTSYWGVESREYQCGNLASHHCPLSINITVNVGETSLLFSKAVHQEITTPNEDSWNFIFEFIKRAIVTTIYHHLLIQQNRKNDWYRETMCAAINVFAKTFQKKTQHRLQFVFDSKIIVEYF